MEFASGDYMKIGIQCSGEGGGGGGGEILVERDDKLVKGRLLRRIFSGGVEMSNFSATR